MQSAPALPLFEKLEAIQQACQHLQDALRKADSQAIFLAVEEQAQALQLLHRTQAAIEQGPEREQARVVIERILELNRHNQLLSRHGLSSIQSAMRRLMPVAAYSADGHSLPLAPDSTIVRSA